MRGFQPFVSCLGLAACAAFGCESVAGYSGGSGDAGDGGVAEEGGACAVACGPNQYCAGGACLPGCPGRIVYVATDGSDSRDGCTPAAAKKTLGAAIAYVKNLGATGHEVHVCRGTYAETGLTLDYPVSLRGGFDCATWARSAKFAWPDLDSVNETIVDNADLKVGANTLMISGKAVGPSVIVDALTIRGAASGNATSSAIGVTSGAAPVIRDSKIRGGGTTSPGPDGTFGVAVTGAAPEIFGCEIEGGSGFGTRAGSAGVAIVGDSPAYLHDCWIRGGSGSSPGAGTGSRGVTIGGPTAGGTLRFERNTIEGGTGSSGSGVPVGAFAVDGDVPLSLISNVIVGGVATCKAAPTCTVVGVLLHANSKPMVIAGNRVFAGEVTGGARGAFFGVYLDGARAPAVLDNTIHSGNRTDVPVDDQGGFGLWLANGADAVVQHNTFFTSTGATGVWLGPNTKRSVVQNNLFLGSGATDVGVALATCTGATVTRLQANGFAGVASVGAELATVTTACDTARAAATVGQMESTVSGQGGVVQGNVRLAASCGTDTASQCRVDAACATSAGCVGAVLTAPTPPDLGFAALIDTGWRLKDSGPCVILRGGADLRASVPLDAYGATRTAPVSIGAHENDATCK